MRYAFVFNQEAGHLRRRAALAAIRETFGNQETEICSDPDDAAAGAWARPAEQVLVAVGGDGTVSRLLPLAARTGAALGILPAGTANDLARTLGIPCDLRAACRALRSGSRQALDLLSVNGVPFATCGGVGLPADAAARANLWRRRSARRLPAARAAGRLVYALAAARELGRTRGGCEVEVEWPGGRLSGPLLAAIACNVPTLGGRYRIAPRARWDDGLLDLCLLPAAPSAPRRAIVLGAALSGSVRSIPGVRLLQARSAILRTERPASFFGDGEILARGRVFALEVLRGALDVVAPVPGGAALPHEEAA